MATSASQPYIARLGFQDPDRSKDRHGLACEYLFERLLEVEIAAPWRESEMKGLRCDINSAARWNQECRERLERIANSTYESAQREREIIAKDIAASFDQHQSAHAELIALEASDGIELARKYLKPTDCINVPIKSGYSIIGFADVLVSAASLKFLGEVKITRQPAEQVLQQINFYKANLSEITATYILADYDCSDLQRLTQGSDVKVFRLGQRFEQWLSTRTAPITPEL